MNNKQQGRAIGNQVHILPGPEAHPVFYLFLSGDDYGDQSVKGNGPQQAPESLRRSVYRPYDIEEPELQGRIPEQEQGMRQSQGQRNIGRPVMKVVKTKLSEEFRQLFP